MFVVRWILYIADHPEAQQLAGIFQSSGAAYPCRFCLVEHSKIFDTRAETSTTLIMAGASRFGRRRDYAEITTHWMAVYEESKSGNKKTEAADSRRWLQKYCIKESIPGMSPIHPVYKMYGVPAEATFGEDYVNKIPVETMHTLSLGLFKDVPQMIVDMLTLAQTKDTRVVGNGTLNLNKLNQLIKRLKSIKVQLLILLLAL